jgi:hypothetical protein
LKQSLAALLRVCACCFSLSAAPAGVKPAQPCSGTLPMSYTGSRCTSVRPAFASDAKCFMPFEPVSVKAAYLPRCAGLTVPSLTEKSRTCSS